MQERNCRRQPKGLGRNLLRGFSLFTIKGRLESHGNHRRLVQPLRHWTKPNYMFVVTRKNTSRDSRS